MGLENFIIIEKRRKRAWKFNIYICIYTNKPNNAQNCRIVKGRAPHLLADIFHWRHNQMSRQIVTQLWCYNRMTPKSHLESHKSRKSRKVNCECYSPWFLFWNYWGTSVDHQNNTMDLLVWEYVFLLIITIHLKRKPKWSLAFSSYLRPKCSSVPKPFFCQFKEKRKRSDSFLWQKPLHKQKCQKGKVTT